MKLMGKKAPNMDHETGIHYGVIPRNSCNSDSVEEIYSNGTDLGYEHMIAETKANIRRELKGQDFPRVEDSEGLAYREAAINAFKAIDHDLKDVDLDDIQESLLDCSTLDDACEVIWNEIEDGFGENFDSDGPYSLTDGEVKVQIDSDGDIWVFKSPFYTLCGECSPCAPNAGYLTTRSNAMKAYALPQSWFDDFGPEAAAHERNWMPYNLYKVEDESLVARGRDKAGYELEDDNA